MSCPIHGPCPICAAEKWIGDPRESVTLKGLPFTHWSKDPLIPYNGCKCSSCEDARMPVVVSADQSREQLP